ncbi:MAG: glycoside hydrolase family 43 protein [Prevotellaceae bacterium]|nr:glycoside hydrolase family 43 protein [Prevotellaceae bacterium]
MKKNILISLACFASIGIMAQTKLTANEMKNMYKPSNNTAVSIHDPSVVYNHSDNTYYIVGSHMGLASSTQLVSFTGLNNSSVFNTSTDKAFASNPTHTVQVTRNGITSSETLGSFDAGAFCSTYSTKSQTEWINGNMWAPDMIYNPNMNKWCMYLSLNGENWASVIIMLTSDSPKGPFKYQGPIVFSGFNGQTYSQKSVSYKDTDLELVLGEQTSLPARYRTNAWGNLWPNCIDPCVFFDEQGELWMSYGSWSGGIFMLKLNKDTGLRDYTYTYSPATYSGTAPNGARYTGYTSDPYFGKLIAGGAYVSGEGSYIEKIGDYYYLFMSYGAFDPDGGYEMRIFRSSNPDGPYVDASGNSALYTSYVLNYGPNARTNKGMKIIGAMNNWGTMTVGECAEGHNSAIVDKDGDAFVVYHTKFNDGTFGHLVRTRQLFVNEKGWLVSSPFKYTGKQTTQSIIESKQLFSADSIAGVYKLLIHPYRLDHSNMAEATPLTVKLTADGKISGDRTGTWQYTAENKSFVRLVIGGVTYYGVAMNQNVDGYTDMPAMCFTAVSNTGVPMWLYKYHPKAAVASAYNSIVTDYLTSSNTISSSAPVVDNVISTFTAINTTTKEPDSETLSESGIFTPTEDGHRISVNIKLESGNYFYTAGPYIKYTMKKGEQPATPVYYPMSTNKNTTSAWWTNFSTKDYSLNKGESIEFKFYNYSSKKNNWNNWCLYGANTTHGGNDYTEYFGIRCDNWDNTSSSNNGCSSNFNWDTFTTDMDQSLVQMTVEYNASGIFTMKSTITTLTGKVYEYSYTKTIATSPSSINLFFVNEGSYIDGSNIPTGIQQPGNTLKPVTNNKVYNIYGQEVGKEFNGIKIIKGKKYINRDIK